MIEPADLVKVVGATAVLTVAFVLVVRATSAWMRRRVRAGLRVSPLLKRLFGFSYACTCNRTLTIELPDSRDTVKLDELAEIRYRYHAVGSFIAWLEFVDTSGRCVFIEQSVDGIEDDVLPWLERQLPGFKQSALAKCIEEGDVEDVCCIWIAA